MIHSVFSSRRLSAAAILLVFSIAANAQVKWASSLHENASFIPNTGQFDERANGAQARYAVDHGSTLILLTDNGITYRFDDKAKNHYRKRGEKSQPRMLISSEFV